MRLLALCLFLFAGSSVTAFGQDAGHAPRDLGPLADSAIDEASGLVVGRANPHVLWTHNDSGDRSRIFAIDLEGRTLATVEVRGARNRDWEDMAARTVKGRHLLYVGDIGDNVSRYKRIRIYRFPEPVLSGGAGATLEVDRFDTLELRYPDGARNAETLLVDPASGDIVIVTKGTNRPEVYRASVPPSGDAEVTLRRVGNLAFEAIPFGDDAIEGGVGGDVSADGRFVLVKSYLRVYRWAWDGTRDFPFIGEPETLPYLVEPQGEAIAIAVDGLSWYTLSEKDGTRIPRLYAYEGK